MSQDLRNFRWGNDRCRAYVSIPPKFYPYTNDWKCLKAFSHQVMGTGCPSPRSIAILFNNLSHDFQLTPKPTYLVFHGGSKVMIVQSNISLVPHAVLIHLTLSSTLPVVFPHEVIHDYINVTFSHILSPFPDNFLLISLTVVKILLLESFSLFVDFMEAQILS